MWNLYIYIYRFRFLENKSHKKILLDCGFSLYNSCCFVWDFGCMKIYKSFRHYSLMASGCLSPSSFFCFFFGGSCGFGSAPPASWQWQKLESKEGFKLNMVSSIWLGPVDWFLENLKLILPEESFRELWNQNYIYEVFWKWIPGISSIWFRFQLHTLRVLLFANESETRVARNKMGRRRNKHSLMASAGSSSSFFCDSFAGASPSWTWHNLN